MTLKNRMSQADTFVKQKAFNGGRTDTAFFKEIEMFEKYLEEDETEKDARRRKINELYYTIEKAIKLVASLKDGKHTDPCRNSQMKKISALEKEMHLLQGQIKKLREEIDAL